MELVKGGWNEKTWLGEYLHTPQAFIAYLDLALAAASISARNARVFSRNAIFCFRSLLKRAVSPQVFDI
jgi:hypothetical protein